MTELVERVGAQALGMVEAARGLTNVLVRTLARTFRRRRGEPGEVLRQMFEVGNRSLVFIAVTLGFLGMVLVFQSSLQVSRITGDPSPIGPQFFKILVHEFGPTLTAQMLATRVGAGIAAEIGSMVVTEQVDALRMCGVDPIEYLVVPRFIACMVMTVALTIFAVVVAFFAGALTAKLSFGVNPATFINFAEAKVGDVLTGLTKCIAYGAAIPVVSGYCGLTAGRGSEGVGSATTRAVIGSSFTVIVLDFILSSVGYFVFQGGA
ncbi:MAG TPA: ABC transporter permease [Haliangiales bacterium]|nr:ABC transporter permease [Haliangiales bacterium]